MARGRMLNQTVATDKKLNSLSIEAELLYLKTIPHLDRDGLILGDPTLLWAKVCPRRPELMSKIDGLVNELISSELVVAYVADDEQILFFPGFSKNQANMRYEREPASTYPPPPGYRRTSKGLQEVENTTPNLTPTFAGSLPEVCRKSADTLPPEEKRREEKRKGAPPTSGVNDDEKSGSGGSGLSRQTDPAYAEVCTAIEQNGFGMMTPIIADEVGTLLAEYPKDWILDAMKVSVQQNKRKLSYTAGILRKWRADGRDAKAPTTNGSVTVDWSNYGGGPLKYMEE